MGLSANAGPGGGLGSDLPSGLVEDILEHIGVKGMRWGVRKSERSSSDGGPTIKVTTKSGKGIVKVSGGKGLEPSADAVKVAATAQKAKKSTTAALSNEEMKLLVSRMQLEANYSKLSAEANKQKKEAGLGFVTKLVKKEGASLLAGKKGPVVAALASAFTLGKQVHNMATATPSGKHRKI
jgi:hypothetical protein